MPCSSRYSVDSTRSSAPRSPPRAALSHSVISAVSSIRPRRPVGAGHGLYAAWVPEVAMDGVSLAAARLLIPLPAARLLIPLPAARGEGQREAQGEGSRVSAWRAWDALAALVAGPGGPRPLNSQAASCQLIRGR